MDHLSNKPVDKPVQTNQYKPVDENEPVSPETSMSKYQQNNTLIKKKNATRVTTKP